MPFPRFRFEILNVFLFFAALVCAHASPPAAAPSPKQLATVPVMTSDDPAPGRRVRQTEPEYAGTDVHHSLYLPPDFGASGAKGGDAAGGAKDASAAKKHPLIVEYTGNYFPASGSTGEVSGANLGFAATLGKEYVWIVLPYVAAGGKHNERTWWGDEAETIRYAKLCIRRAIEKYDIDPKRVVLCGFSRGAVGVGYLGLHDDEIAGLWSAFMTHDHFDGVLEWKRTTWGSPLEKYRAEAAVRLRRLKGRPVWVGQNGTTKAVGEFLAERDLLGVARFQFEAIPIKEIFPQIPNAVFKHPHTDLWPLFESEYATRLREWLRRVGQCP